MTPSWERSVREVYVLNATREAPPGLFCFCPLRFNDKGLAIGVMTGLTVISTEPPEGSHYAGVFHERDFRAAEEWAREHEGVHADLKARFGVRIASALSANVR